MAVRNPNRTWSTRADALLQNVGPGLEVNRTHEIQYSLDTPVPVFRPGLGRLSEASLVLPFDHWPEYRAAAANDEIHPAKTTRVLTAGSGLRICSGAVEDALKRRLGGLRQEEMAENPLFSVTALKRGLLVSPILARLVHRINDRFEVAGFGRVEPLQRGEGIVDGSQPLPPG